MVMTAPSAPVCESASSTPAFQQHFSFTSNHLQRHPPPTTPARTLNNVRRRIHPLTDLSLLKVFKVKERTSLEIRGEFFNVIHAPNFPRSFVARRSHLGPPDSS